MKILSLRTCPKSVWLYVYGVMLQSVNSCLLRRCVARVICSFAVRIPYKNRQPNTKCFEVHLSILHTQPYNPLFACFSLHFKMLLTTKNCFCISSNLNFTGKNFRKVALCCTSKERKTMESQIKNVKKLKIEKKYATKMCQHIRTMSERTKSFPMLYLEIMTTILQ